MSYIYLKKKSKAVPAKIKRRRLLAAGFVFLGLTFLSLAVFPIVKFQLSYSTRLKQIIDPLSAESYDQPSILGQSATDYTQLSNWFINSPELPNLSSQTIDTSISSYYLTIPKLKINRALVTLGSMDLEKSLIHYPQTALPGHFGNTVIFGHSVLPQFFSPKNYLTIFSTLFKLNQGDEIILEYDKSTYKYIVEEMFEVKPTNLSVLDQRFDDKTLTLITCSPPGTYLRRLIIKASLGNN
ncbi:MAG TPA: sortase [Candidatus Woesebacteria bacterium]|nr:sortase [Candidatus Shapirobacteria bacterium]HOR01882.1 sortase [Candidatus Woesebacteria bacterium]